MHGIKCHNMLSELIAKIDDYNVISFDIFDTLLLRAYVNPTDLFYHLEKLNNEEGFASKRMLADVTARQKNPHCEEITLDQIYQVLEVNYQYLKQKEMELEQSVLTANPEMLEVYNYAKSQGKKIIIASDMYLPKEFIEKLLHENGFLGYDKLYLSSDLGLTKRSANLYKYMIEDLKTPSSKILHIGDNQHSDCEVATSLGIIAFYYEKVILRFLKKNTKAAVFYQGNINNVGASIILGVSAIRCLNSEGLYWNNFGYDYAGPAAYGYAEWLYKKIKGKNIKEILFVARDGYTLQKVFELFKDDEIKTHYFYAPRLFYFAVTLNPLSKISTMESEKLSATKFILDYYRNKHSYLKDNTPDIDNPNIGLSFIQTNLALYQELALKEIMEYLKYIELQNIESGDVALVDSMSISLSSQKLLTSFIEDKIIYGYYWWFNEETSLENPEFNCDAFQEDDKSMLCGPLIELLLSAPSAPIQAIADGKPVYKQNLSEYEKTRIEKYSFVSDGALEFANDVQKYFKGKATFIDYQNILSLFKALGQNPSNDDLIYLEEIQHSVDSNHSQYLQTFSHWYQQKVKA